MLGSFLTQEIYKTDREASIYGWGGPQMRSSGVEILRDLNDLQKMGISDLLKDPLLSFRIISSCKKDISQIDPDLLILVDYGGLNLQIAKWAKKKGYRVLYFIPPKIWASRGWRIKALQKNVDLLAVIYPFEQTFYTSKGITALLIKNPWLKKVQAYTDQTQENSTIDDGGRPVAAVLPGSRKKEIKHMIPRILPVISSFPEMLWHISIAPGIDKEEMLQLIPDEDKDRVILFDGHVYELLSQSEIAVVTSGTATLETALFKVPQVVCYHTSQLNYLLAKRLITVPYISLVNLILGEPAVVELIQKDMQTARLISEIKKLRDDNEKKKLIDKYQRMKTMLDMGKDISELARLGLQLAKSR